MFQTLAQGGVLLGNYRAHIRLLSASAAILILTLPLLAIAPVSTRKKARVASARSGSQFAAAKVTAKVVRPVALVSKPAPSAARSASPWRVSSYAKSSDGDAF